MELIFTPCPYLSLLIKKITVQGEDKLKGSAQANLERNRQRFEGRKLTGSDLAASTRELAASTRPLELILRQDRAVQRAVYTTRHSRIFGDRRVCGDGFFCQLLAPSHCRLCCRSSLVLPLASKAYSRLALAYVIGRINEEKTQRRASLTKRRQTEKRFQR